MRPVGRERVITFGKKSAGREHWVPSERVGAPCLVMDLSGEVQCAILWQEECLKSCCDCVRPSLHLLQRRFRDQGEKFSRQRNTETQFIPDTHFLYAKCRAGVKRVRRVRPNPDPLFSMAPRRYRKELFLRRDGQGEPREMTDDRSVTSRITLTVAIVTKT